MPLFHHPVLRPLRRDRPAVEHPGLADREIGDVDHLLDFAVALRLDLAVLERDQRAERVLVLAEERSERAHGVATLRRRHVAPRLGGGDRRRDDGVDVGGIGEAHARERRARGRILGDDRRAAASPEAGPEARSRMLRRKAELREQCRAIDRGVSASSPASADLHR